MEFLNSSILEFSQQLASSAPVPGGGGASALAGALGVALGNMVGELTVGKPRYASVEAEMKSLMAKAQDLRGRLLACVERDAAAFEPLSRAYGIPKDDPSREAVMEQCLRDAAAVPLEILELCGQALDLQREFSAKGSRLVASDAATGAALCWGAMQGAAINVRVNTRLMRERPYAKEIEDRVDAQLNTYGELARQIIAGGKEDADG